MALRRVAVRPCSRYLKQSLFYFGIPLVQYLLALAIALTVALAIALTIPGCYTECCTGRCIDWCTGSAVPAVRGGDVSRDDVCLLRHVPGAIQPHGVLAARGRACHDLLSNYCAAGQRPHPTSRSLQPTAYNPQLTPNGLCTKGKMP